MMWCVLELFAHYVFQCISFGFHLSVYRFGSLNFDSYELILNQFQFIFQELTVGNNCVNLQIKYELLWRLQI